MAASWGFDWSGISLLGPQPNHGRVVAFFVGFCVFLATVIIREIDLLLQPHPNVKHESIKTVQFQNAEWLRVVLRNKVSTPSGERSNSVDTKAKISVYSLDGKIFDKWNGRWSDSGWPKDYGDIANKNKWTINANDTAELDIGRRFEGESWFKGHDNRTIDSPEPSRKLLKPNIYYVKIELSATNMKPKEIWFTLRIPNDNKKIEMIFINKRIKFTS